MKIALVSPYDFSYPGGVVRHISNLEMQFTRMGHLVKIIAPASRPVEGYGDRFIAIGKPRPIPASGSIARITISFNLANKVKDVLEKEQFDIVHLHEPLVPTLGFTVLRLSKSVNIGTFHAAEARPSYRWTKYLLVSRLYKKWFRKLTGRIAVSRPARDFVNRHYPSTYEIIPNGVDINFFSPSVSPISQFKDGKINILFLGRLETRKGLEYLLKAYALIKPDFQVHLYNYVIEIIRYFIQVKNGYEKTPRFNVGNSMRDGITGAASLPSATGQGAQLLWRSFRFSCRYRLQRNREERQ